MPKVMVTTLQPAPSGFGAWQWIEAEQFDGVEEIRDYERACVEAGNEPIHTDELNGRIHDQRGIVLKFDASYMAGGERVEDWHYEMVWIEDEEGGN